MLQGKPLRLDENTKNTVTRICDYKLSINENGDDRTSEKLEC